MDNFTANRWKPAKNATFSDGPWATAFFLGWGIRVYRCTGIPVAIYLYQIYILHLIPISSYSADNLIIHFLTVESLPHVSYIYIIWLVVSTPLKNISQLGWLVHILLQNKNHVPNHQPVYRYHIPWNTHSLAPSKTAKTASAKSASFRASSGTFTAATLPVATKTSATEFSRVWWWFSGGLIVTGD